MVADGAGADEEEDELLVFLDRRVGFDLLDILRYYINWKIQISINSDSVGTVKISYKRLTYRFFYLTKHRVLAI